MDDFDDNNEVINSFVGPSQVDRIKRTPEGGIAILLINGSGAVSVKGQLVTTSVGIDGAVDLAHANNADVIGAFYESGIADTEEVWVVILGAADVLLKDNTGTTRGNWVGASDEAGYAYATESSPPAQPVHFREVGHCMETVVAGGAGTHVMCRIMMHFN